MKHLCAISILLALSSPAFAQETPDDETPTEAEPAENGEAEPPAEDREARAFELNEQGLQAFQDGRYADAARAFADAWSYSRDETLRKNEAIAWFRAGECEPSVEAGNKFLMLDDVSDGDRILINSLIANCKAEFARRAIDAGDLELADSLLTDAESRETDSVAKDRVAAVRVDLAAARRAAEDAKPPPEPEIRTVYVPSEEPDPPYLGWALLGGGGAVVAGSLVYHLIALGWQREFKTIAGDRTAGSEEKFDSLRKRVHLARILVPIGYGMGAITAGAGATVVFYLERTPPETADARSGLTFGVRGTF